MKRLDYQAYKEWYKANVNGVWMFKPTNTFTITEDRAFNPKIKEWVVDVKNDDMFGAYVPERFIIDDEAAKP